MKTLLRLLCPLFVIVVASCAESDFMVGRFKSVGSRAITPGMESETNPDLLSDWENCKIIMLNKETASGRLQSATPPWGDGAITRLDPSFCKDVKKADGWIMLFHTFCKANLDEDLTYICLYNQFTGYIKVFYYAYEADLGTSTVWSMSSGNTCEVRSLFSDNEYFSQPLNGDDKYTIWSVTADNMPGGNSRELSKGWNGFQFRVGEYSPKNSIGDYKITAYNTVYTNFNFNGEQNSTTTGTIATLNTSDESLYNNAISKAVLNQVGDKAKDAVDKFASKNLDKSFLGLNVKDILSNIKVNNYAGAIAKGLGFVFKCFSRSEPSYSISEVNLKTHGTLVLQGVGTTPTVSKVVPLSFNMENVLNGGGGSLFSAISSYGVTDNLELGVWNLRKKPILLYERYTKFENLVPTDYEHLSVLEFHGLCALPNTIVDVDGLEVVFNPAIKPYVKSYGVTAGVIDVTGGNRSLNHKGKNYLGYDRRNFLIDNDGALVYGVSKGETSVYAMIDRVPQGLMLNDNTQFYVDWGRNVSGCRAAVITLTMNIDYKGKQMSITESRIYDVDYEPSTRGLNHVDNPPNTYLLSDSNCSILSFDI